MGLARVGRWNQGVAACGIVGRSASPQDTSRRFGSPGTARRNTPNPGRLASKRSSKQTRVRPANRRTQGKSLRGGCRAARRHSDFDVYAFGRLLPRDSQKWRCSLSSARIAEASATSHRPCPPRTRRWPARYADMPPRTPSGFPGPSERLPRSRWTGSTMSRVGAVRKQQGRPESARRPQPAQGTHRLRENEQWRHAWRLRVPA